MSTLQRNRLDPSDISPEALKALSEVLAQTGSIGLIDEAGHRTEVPEPIVKLMSRIVSFMSQHRPVVMLPTDETFTTQAAANHLGMSRQHLVNLLESGAIPFDKVGTHRRIKFADLIAYEQQRDKERREGLDGLMRQVDEAGLYDASYTGND